VIRRLALFTLCVTLFACVHGTSYRSVLARETHQTRAYTLEKVQYMTAATYESRAFRQAYVDEYARNYNLTPEKKQEMLTRELAEADLYDVFFISHYATDKEVAKLATRAAAWKISLESPRDPAIRLEPIEVAQVASGNDPVLRHFFPHVHLWSRNYVVKFEKKAPDGDLTLHLDGVAGNVEFTWKP